MPIYSNAPEEVTDRIDRLIQKHHPELEAAEVDVRALFANSENDSPPVKLGGYECYAIVKIVGAKERVQGLGDALIIIDEERWKKLNERRRDALIDHELMHLQVQKDSAGFVKKDDHERPRLKMKLHDWQLGGFAQVTKWYGADALEAQSIKVASDAFGQSFWVFGESERFGGGDEPIGKVARGRRTA